MAEWVVKVRVWVRVRGRGRVRARVRNRCRRRVKLRVRGRMRVGYRRPFPPHGSEGIAMVGKMGQRLHSLSPGRQRREGSLREQIFPPLQWGCEQE